jgi:uncharacterized membrane protein YgaE (UPF0421/DUF939 family)
MNDNKMTEKEETNKSKILKNVSVYNRPPVSNRPRSSGLKGAFHWNRGPNYPWGKAIAAAFSIGIPFMIGALFNHMDWALLASIGSFTALYVDNEPYSQRAIKLWVVNIGLVLSFGLGLISSAFPLSMAIVFSLVSACSTFFSGVFKIPPPAGYFFVLVCAVGTLLPFDLSSIPFRLGVAFLGGCFAWLMGMSGWLWNPYLQEKLAVIKVYRQLSSYLSTIGRKSSDLEKHNLTIALKTAEEAVLTSPFRRIKKTGNPLYLIHLIEKANDLFLSAIECEARVDGPIENEIIRGPQIIADAILQSKEIVFISQESPHSNENVVMKLQEELKEAAIILNERSLTYNQLIQGPNRDVKSLLKSAIDHTSVVLPASLRIGLAVLVASLLAILFGNERPYWVSLACASALQGATTLAIVHRTIQRTIGTAIGILIGGMILFFHASPWELVLIVMVLQLIIELIIVRNYTLAVIFITPLAFIITFFSHVELSTTTLIEARLIDTLLGAAVALLAGLFFWHRTSSSRLPKILSAAIQLSGKLLQDLLQEKHLERNPLVRERKRLLTLLINLRAVYDGAVSEVRKNQKVIDSYWSAIVATQRLGYFIVAASENPKNITVTKELMKQIEKTFSDLAEGVQQERTNAISFLPAIPEYPGISEEISELIECLSIIKKK